MMQKYNIFGQKTISAPKNRRKYTRMIQRIIEGRPIEKETSNQEKSLEGSLNNLDTSSLKRLLNSQKNDEVTEYVKMFSKRVNLV